MKIAVDASLLNEVSRTGTHNYLYYLLSNLAKLDKENEYELYFKSKEAAHFYGNMFLESKNFSFTCLNKFISWTHVSLALQLFIHSPDILICPWHTMPFLHLRKTKVIAIFHAANEHAKNHNLFVKLTAKLSTNIIAVSNYTKEMLVELFKINPSKIKVIYEGIETTDYYAYEENTIKEVTTKYNINNPYILSISTITPRKNVENMLHAFAQSLSSPLMNNYVYVIAGKMTPECNYLLELPRKLSIEDKVFFIGSVPIEDGPKLIAGASLLAYVSKSEGFGLNVLEGMNSNVPVLSTITGAVPEVAGDAAVLVNPESIEDISVGYINLLTNKVLRDSYIKKGAIQVTKFSWVTTATETLNYIFEVHNAKR